MSALQIGLIMPETMGAYGDSGNAIVLEKRLQKRGFDAEIVTVHVGDEVPDSLDFYLLGGSEDAAQQVAVQRLEESGALRRAADRGAIVFAVCAGLQVLGASYEDEDGRQVDGLGLLDVQTRRGTERSVGELVTTALLQSVGEPLTGFENHLGVTELGADAQPLGAVLHGHGNALDLSGEGQRVDGAVQGSVFATYMHGPVLARNPQLADYLIRLATGQKDLNPIDTAATALLRKQRLEASGITLK
ncbi:MULTISPECIES: type 1 glutamine amidotransferase [Actinomycetaceae]|uniref:Lipid II isoglutaminyl synthase (glutamine-hydrolyzing) subunit GatD n=1 Tax=Gleimia europaea ACS-120-V-Col10b TaxID=883069 RepID=A0A9W5RFK6_9ACTO|nr:MULTISPECIES: hypothetical protein [Actinomycetaceae]EPD31559.1 hypothetical protein HMPREF9238_01335 [Gleimia europaea ACS-120-V-Col10b]MBS5826515.1 glutamine amidotransferase [Actinomyces sp.]OFR33621.1 glutamine amidotransferase [Actinomyces sp. HMSC065F11]